MDRRTWLRTTGALALGISLPPLTGRPPVPTSDPTRELMSQLDHLRALHWSGTPVSDVWFGLMQLAAETEQMTTLVSPETERALRGVLARTLGIAGTVAVVDLDNHNASERALLRGLSAARKSDDSRLIAWLYGKLAHRRIYDFSGNRIANLLEALKYVQYADRYAGDNPVVLADLLNTKGEALAALGRESAIGDIHVAGTMMESAPEDITPEWLSHFNEWREPFARGYRARGQRSCLCADW